MKPKRKRRDDGVLTEVQRQKGDIITLDWLNGENYPPAVSINKKDGELICWNFMHDYREGGYYAEGSGRPWPEHERKRFYKCVDLGKDKEKAMDVYYRLIAQTKKPTGHGVL